MPGLQVSMKLASISNFLRPNKMQLLLNSESSKKIFYDVDVSFFYISCSIVCGLAKGGPRPGANAVWKALAW